MNKKWRSICPNKSVCLFLLPGLSGVVVFYILPFLDVVRRSFYTAMSGEFTGMENFNMVLEKRAFVLAVTNTVKFMAICIPLLLILSLVLAVILYRSRFGEWVKNSLLFPLAVPVSAVVLIWRLLFDKAGLINGGITAFGGNAVDFLGGGASFYVLVFSYLWKNLGYTVVLWLAGMRQIPSSILEAAKVDGAGEVQCIIKIVLPNLKPVFYTIALLSLFQSFKVYREAFLIAGNYPPEEIYLLQHLLNNWFTNLELDKMAAASVMMSAVLLLFILLFWHIMFPAELESGERVKKPFLKKIIQKLGMQKEVEK